MTERVKLTEAQRKALLAGLTPLGRIMRAMGAVRMFKDGDGVSSVWRWWHPMAWIVWLALLPVCGVVGEPIKHVVPFRLKEYWRARRGQIQWF